MLIRQKIGDSILEIVQGDITVQETESIVNAANNRLSPGGGVSGAIHRAAGPMLWQECKKHNGCDTGKARLTGGYNLKADYVIHTVGPVYSGIKDDADKLKSCYYNSLCLASEKDIKSISFPSISTGIFGYPVKEASNIALRTIIDYLKTHKEIEIARMVLFSTADYEVYGSTLEEILGKYL
jgi:O-acetyl-ADP-ribose deacetylase